MLAKGSFEKAKPVFEEWLQAISKKPVTEKYFNKMQRSVYIKRVYPQVYQKEAQKPVQNKIIFMEREGAHVLSWKYMYEYMQKNTSYEIKVHYLHLREVPMEEYYENARDYIRDAATAKAIFVCSSDDLMGYFSLRPETTYIQLWHGCGVFKKIGLSTIDQKWGKSAASHKEYPINKNYSYVTIASPELSWICYEKLYAKIPEARKKKIILYAPTFRGKVSQAVAPDVLDIARFSEELGDKYILICKHHQLVKEPPEIPEKYRNTFAWDMSKDDEMNINDLMIVSDICISDYSSVVFEYSLMERPMIFFVYDLEDYIDERGLYYDFDEITPGPLCRTNEEIIEYIQNIDEKFDRQVVIDFKNKFMCSCDGHSSERIAALI